MAHFLDLVSDIRIKMPGVVDQGAQLFFMVFAAACAIAAINEVASRDSFFVFLNSEANRIRKEFVDRSQEQPVAEAKRAGDETQQAKLVSSIGAQQLLRDIQELQDLASRVRLLADLGATYGTQTLEHLRNSYQEKRRSDDLAKLVATRDRAARDATELQRRINERSPSTLDSQATISQRAAQLSIDSLKLDLERAKTDYDRLGKEIDERNKAPSQPFSVSERIQQPATLNSDYLLAIAIMACGVMGALIAGMRSDETTSVRDFSRGLSSGFICYLGIKGGKYIFLLHAAGETVGFNPYGSAFAGLLVGLFSQKAYETLEMLFSDLTSRIKQAIDKGNEKAAQTSPAPQPAAPEPGKPVAVK
jgi:hypothetical protein